MAKAMGQFTIIDYNDALTLSSFISSNVVKTQMYNPDNGTYSPDWSVSPFLVLTASLYKIGTTSDVITSSAVQSVQYYELIDGVETLITATTSRVFSGTKNQILTIKTNEMSDVSAKDYICKITYTDETTGLNLIQKCSISFSKVQNGSGLIDAIASTPNGNIFKNDLVTSLTGTIELWRGSSVDTSNVSYQWYKQDSTVTTDEGGGIGWKKLTDTANVYTGVTTGTITVFPNAFDNIGVFKASIKDTDSSSSTYNTYFWDTITFIDNTDPYVVTITSTGGSVFKNGSGSSTLKAIVYQAGYEVDAAGTQFTYKWYKYDKNGDLVTNFGGTGVSYKTGKTLAVTSTDVDVKSTFQAEIE
jgi:hypothetical protein